MRNLTFFTKIALTFVLLITIFTVLISIYSYHSINYHYLKNFTDYLKNNASLISHIVKPLIKNSEIEKIDYILDNMGKNLNFRITVVDRDGVVLGDSLENPKEMENHINRTEIRDALQKGFGKSIRYSTTLEESMLYVAIPIIEGGEILGVVRTSIFLKDLRMLIKDIRNKIFLSSLITALIASLIAIFLAKIFTRPLVAIEKASIEIAKGNLNTEIPESNILEFRELAKNFRNMVESNRELVERMEKERDELRTIIENIKEGLVVTDRKGRIILANPTFKEISKSENINGRYLWEVLRSIEIKDMFDKALKVQVSEVPEIKISNKHYIVSFAILPEEIIFVFSDITPLKEIERTKKELISNISHELRTPLTAIKVFVGTLEERLNDPESLSFINIVKRQTERLINILKDVLTISKLEDRAFQIKKEKVNLNHLTKNTLKLFEKRIKDKGLEVELFFEGNVELEADPVLMEQLLINLIENAINYTERGKIGIKAAVDDSKVKIEIFDTGIGIPEEHIPRIFERFYVVDISRSKETGGTGLGLSIVKHIVLLHNGEIKVESKVGEGTKFIIKLPIQAKS